MIENGLNLSIVNNSFSSFCNGINFVCSSAQKWSKSASRRKRTLAGSVVSLDTTALMLFTIRIRTALCNIVVTTVTQLQWNCDSTTEHNVKCYISCTMHEWHMMQFEMPIYCVLYTVAHGKINCQQHYILCMCTANNSKWAQRLTLTLSLAQK